VNFSFKELNF